MKYSKSLDLIIASLREAQAGKFDNAAVCFEKALKQADVKETIAALNAQNAKAFTEAAAKSPTLSALFTKIGEKQEAAKAKKVSAVAAAKPKAKKAEKAAEEDDLNPVLDDMVAAEDDGESVDGTEFDDLSLDDLEDLEGDDLEMSASEDDEDEEDDKEESAEDEEDDKEDEDDKEEEEDDKEDEDDKEEEEAKGKKKAKAATASKSASGKKRVTLVASNLDALERLSTVIKAKVKARK
jgi:hypothetical protein